VALNIADLFEHSVDVVPDNPALKVGDRVATYAELERDSNRLAHYLASRGVEAGDHVAIYSKNSVEHVIAVLATVKLRATTINVNYRYVEGELDYLFENADVVALLFERPYADLVARCAPKHAKLRTFVALPDVTDRDNADDISAFLLTSWQGAMMRMKVDRSPKPLEQFKRVLFATVLSTPSKPGGSKRRR